jgi:hypothetical protein
LKDTGTPFGLGVHFTSIKGILGKVLERQELRLVTGEELELPVAASLPHVVSCGVFFLLIFHS